MFYKSAPWIFDGYSVSSPIILKKIACYYKTINFYTFVTCLAQYAVDITYVVFVLSNTLYSYVEWRRNLILRCSRPLIALEQKSNTINQLKV